MYTPVFKNIINQVIFDNHLQPTATPAAFAKERFRWQRRSEWHVNNSKIKAPSILTFGKEWEDSKPDDGVLAYTKKA